MKKFFKGLALTILVTVLFVSSLVLLILIPIKSALSKNSIKKMITRINVEQLILAPSSFSQELDSFLEPIYLEAEEYGINKDVIIKIVDSQEIKGFVGDITGNIVNYFLTGKETKIIETSNVTSLVSKTIDEINASGYYEISQENKNNILAIVDEEIKEYEEYIPTSSVFEKELDKETRDTLNVLRFILGGQLITDLLITLIVSLVGIVLIKWSKAKWLKCTAITILCSSLFTTIVYAILMVMNNLFIKEELNYLYQLINYPLLRCLIITLSLAIIMVIVLVTYSVIFKKKNNYNIENN